MNEFIASILSKFAVNWKLKLLAFAFSILLWVYLRHHQP